MLWHDGGATTNDHPGDDGHLPETTFRGYVATLSAKQNILTKNRVKAYACKAPNLIGHTQREESNPKQQREAALTKAIHSLRQVHAKKCHWNAEVKSDEMLNERPWEWDHRIWSRRKCYQFLADKSFRIFMAQIPQHKHLEGAKNETKADREDEVSLLEDYASYQADVFNLLSEIESIWDCSLGWTTAVQHVIRLLLEDIWRFKSSLRAISRWIKSGRGRE